MKSPYRLNIYSNTNTYIMFFLVSGSLLRRSGRLKAKNLTPKKVLSERTIDCLRNGVDDGVKEIYAGKILKRGVVTTRRFMKGEFVLEYAGKYLASKAEYEAHRKVYDENKVPGSFFFSFKFENKWRW